LQQHRASHSGNLQHSHAPIYTDGTNLSGVACVANLPKPCGNVLRTPPLYQPPSTHSKRRKVPRASDRP
jgi:hypothetical protein